MGTVGAFVDAHRNHRHKLDRARKFEDCMEVRIRLLTSITPSYARACQALCLTRCPSDILRQRFRLPSAKAKYPNFPKQSNHHAEKKAMTSRDGRYLLTRIMKSQLIGVTSSVHPMKDIALCLAWSLPPRRILLTQELDPHKKKHCRTLGYHGIMLPRTCRPRCPWLTSLHFL